MGALGGGTGKAGTDGVLSRLAPLVFLVVTANFAIFGSACGRKVTRDIALPGQLSFTGRLDPATIPEGGGLMASVVDVDGLRREAGSFAVDPESGEFFLALDPDLVVPRLGLTQPEKIAAMGAEAPASADPGGAFAGAAYGFYRVEIYERSALAAGGSARYVQFAVPVSRAAALGGGGPVRIEGVDGLPLAAVGTVAVKVQDGAGSAVSEAQVMLLPLSGAVVEDQRASPLLPWEAPGSAPAFNVADSAGEATAMALPLDGEPKFQLVAIAPGHCLAVSDQTVYPPKSGERMIVTLPSCADGPAAGQYAWSAGFGPGVATQAETGRFGDQAAARINGDELPLRLLTRGTELRPLRVRLYDGENAGGKVLVESTWPTHMDSVTFVLPKFLDGESRSDGPFTVVVESLVSPADVARLGAAPSATLYGVRKTTPPRLGSASLLIRSVVETDDVISGAAGGVFLVRTGTTVCPDGGAIGIALGAGASKAAAMFATCAGGQATFKVDDLLARQSLLIGQTDVAVYLRDLYGNESDNVAVLLSGEPRQVFIDPVTPDLATQPLVLNSDFGVAPAGATPGSAGSPYDFGAPAAAVRLKRSSVADYVFRFASASHCRLGVADAGDTSGTGHLVSGYQAAATAAGLQEPKGDTVCPDDLSLTDALIAWPESPASPATFVLQVTDQAGNVSKPFTVSIPPCGTAVPLCWEN